MKALHWARVILSSSSPVHNNSIWTQVNALDVKIAQDEIVGLFAEVGNKLGLNAKVDDKSANKDDEKAVSTGEDKKPTTVVKVLSDKRFNAVAIMLSFLPTPDQVIKAIKMLDTKVLDKDAVAQLFKQMPTEEEINIAIENPVTRLLFICFGYHCHMIFMYDRPTHIINVIFCAMIVMTGWSIYCPRTICSCFSSNSTSEWSFRLLAFSITIS